MVIKVKRTLYLTPEANAHLNIMASAYMHSTGTSYGAHSNAVVSAINFAHNHGTEITWHGDHPRDYDPYTHHHTTHGHYHVRQGCPHRPGPHDPGCQNSHSDGCPT